MKVNQVIYDCKTGQQIIREIKVENIIEETPTHQEPTLEDRIRELEEINKEQDELINTTMLATDEMYSLLEPLFIDMLNDKDVSPLLNMYIAMVKRELKKIEQVPEKYREQVDNIINNK